MTVLLTVSFAWIIYRLYKLRNKNIIFKVISYSICFLAYILLEFFLFTRKCDQIISVKPNSSGDIITDNRNIVDKSVTNIDNSSHINNSKTYNYSKHPVRTINGEDIAKLKTKLPERDAKIIVQYLKDNQQDTLLWKQVFNKLSTIGYTKVYLSQATSLPDNLTSGKMTIIKETIDLQTQYKVIINPQQ